MAGRYKAEGPEAEFEPGLRGRVLRNRLGIKSVREIERKESEALLSATEQMIDETRIDQCFTPDYLRRMHRVWLGEIYVWAGEYRQVNMAKGSFMFAAANQVPKLMHEFGRGALRDYTPCRFGDDGELGYVAGRGTRRVHPSWICSASRLSTNSSRRTFNQLRGHSTSRRA
jgi:cell filamentation protein